MANLLDLLLPPRCPGCGIEGAAPCAQCARQLARRLYEPAGVPIGLAAGLPAGLVQLEWCSAFSGPARASLHALKYDGERRLTRPLAGLMAARWRQAAIGGQVLVPVPVHAQRRRERGFDQAELLALEVGRQLGLPCLTALQRSARTVAQHALGRQARAGNVGRAFAVRERHVAAIRGRWIVLVDDIVTTGVTMSACAHALRAAGAVAVSGLALARER